MRLSTDVEQAVVSFEALGDKATAVLRFSGEEEFFRGHFPEGPVLPAVVQVGAAVRLAGRVLGRKVHLAEVTRAKFTNPVGPASDLTFSIETENDGNGRTRVKVEIRHGDVDVAAFTIRVT